MLGSFRNLFHAGIGHQALLTLWGAAHYGSALLAFCILCSLMRCCVTLLFHWGGHSNCDSAQSLAAQFVCLALFGITYYRFSRGDQRYLTWIYRALKGDPAPDLLDEEEKRQFRRDLLAFIGRALVFTALANNITEPAFFFFPFALLLLVDIPWLFARYRQNRGDPRCAETLLRWLVNNLLTLLVLVALIVLHSLGRISAEEFLWLSALSCFTNCVVDLTMTRWVYRIP